ncbi:polysaccharide lyase [Flaviaesturariibacter flavus]|uniref:polysaccharide lyase n=1 Tax=Flaviaesturariibacter flavus TaxID=2502780 RepID=UPI001A9DD080|nr:hypothetical protein [Flaviaesturariibacter flavus]
MLKHQSKWACLAAIALFTTSLVSCSKDQSILEGKSGKITVGPGGAITSGGTTSTGGGTTATGGTSTSGTGTTSGGTTSGGTTSTGGSTSTGSTTPTSSLYSLNLNWAGRADAAYGYTQAVTDFKNIPFWGKNTSISGGTLKTVLLKNMIGPDGGNVSRVDIPDAQEYQLNFDMKFDAGFDWSAGGKVGFGFLLGEGNTGGDPAWDGNGGSARIMWTKRSDGTVKLIPYIYYKDQPGTYGDELAKQYPATGSLQKGTWYNVKMYVKSNTGSNTDGRIQIVINGTTLIDQAIRWTTNDAQRLVKHLCFETFRGGAESYWQSATDGSIYFNNVAVTAIR